MNANTKAKPKRGKRFAPSYLDSLLAEGKQEMEDAFGEKPAEELIRERREEGFRENWKGASEGP